MDTTEHYKIIARQVLATDAAVHPPSPEGLQAVVVADDHQGRYLLIYIGWTAIYRAHEVIVHIAVQDGRVIIEEDGTEEGMSDALIAAGVQPTDIVLAFQQRPVGV